MHTILKIGISLVILGFLLSFVVSPMIANMYSADLNRQLIANAQTKLLSPGDNLTITFNGGKGSSILLFIYNTSTHVPLKVEGVNSSPSLLGNHTYIYPLNPSLTKIQLVNNQSQAQNVYYSYAYASEFNIITIEILGIVSIAALFVGIGMSIVGLLVGRRKRG